MSSINYYGCWLNSNLSSGLSSISSLISLTSGLRPTGIDFITQLNKKFMAFTCNSIVPITSSVAMDVYSKGIFISTDNSTVADGCLIAIDPASGLYVAFRNGSNWNYARKL